MQGLVANNKTILIHPLNPYFSKTNAQQQKRWSFLLQPAPTDAWPDRALSLSRYFGQVPDNRHPPSTVILVQDPGLEIFFNPRLLTGTAKPQREPPSASCKGSGIQSILCWCGKRQKHLRLSHNQATPSNPTPTKRKEKQKQKRSNIYIYMS